MRLATKTTVPSARYARIAHFWVTTSLTVSNSHKFLQKNGSPSSVLKFNLINNYVLQRIELECDCRIAKTSWFSEESILILMELGS
jgi:hypothetical protein